MICPYCNTVNLDERENCYYCDKDLSMLRLIVNKAKHHYNLAVEHAERSRFYEAIVELQNSLDLNKSNINARVLLGTVYAKQKKFEEAIIEWEKALSMSSSTEKAHNYINKARKVENALPVLRWVKPAIFSISGSVVIILVLIFLILRPSAPEILLKKAVNDYNNKQYGAALDQFNDFEKKHSSSSLSHIAHRLSESIKKEINIKKDAIQIKRSSGDYSETLTLCNELSGLNPGRAVDQYLVYIRDDVKFALKKSIEAKIRKLDGNNKNIPVILAEINNMAKLFPEEKSIAVFRNKLKNLHKKVDRERILAKQFELDSIISLKNPKESLQQLEEFKTKNPAFSAKANVQKRIRSIKLSLLSEELENTRKQILANDFYKAAASIRNTSSMDIKKYPVLYNELNSLKLLLNSRKSIQEKELVRKYMSKIQMAVRDNNTEAIKNLVARKDSFKLTKMETDTLNNVIQECTLRL
jgi:hypothetical protein